MTGGDLAFGAKPATVCIMPNVDLCEPEICVAQLMNVRWSKICVLIPQIAIQVYTRWRVAVCRLG